MLQSGVLASFIAFTTTFPETLLLPTECSQSTLFTVQLLLDLTSATKPEVEDTA